LGRWGGRIGTAAHEIGTKKCKGPAMENYQSGQRRKRSLGGWVGGGPLRAEHDNQKGGGRHIEEESQPDQVERGELKQADIKKKKQKRNHIRYCIAEIEKRGFGRKEMGRGKVPTGVGSEMYKALGDFGGRQEGGREKGQLEGKES